MSLGSDVKCWEATLSSDRPPIYSSSLTAENFFWTFVYEVDLLGKVATPAEGRILPVEIRVANASVQAWFSHCVLQCATHGVCVSLIKDPHHRGVASPNTILYEPKTPLMQCDLSLPLSRLGCRLARTAWMTGPQTASLANVLVSQEGAGRRMLA